MIKFNFLTGNFDLVNPSSGGGPSTSELETLTGSIPALSSVDLDFPLSQTKALKGFFGLSLGAANKWAMFDYSVLYDGAGTKDVVSNKIKAGLDYAISSIIDSAKIRVTLTNNETAPVVYKFNLFRY